MIIILILFSQLSHAVTPFTDNQCLDSEYEVELKQSVAFWGAIERKLELVKDKCLIEIQTTKFWFIKKKWIVDVCREPVHIKTGTTSDKVVRFESCGNHSGLNDNGELLKPEYCQLRDGLYSAIQNQGLIFAEGEKEYLETDHGKVVCAYELAKKYLNESFIFNRSKKYDGLVSLGSSEKRADPDMEIEKSPMGEKKIEEAPVEDERKGPVIREL